MAQIPSADLPVVNKDTGRINLEWYAALQRLVSEIAALGSGGVTSFEGRTGVVVAAAGDYLASEVDNDSGVAGAQVSDALDTLDAGKVGNARQVISGAGLTGGGDLSADRTLAVGAGTGISVAADAVSTNDSEIVHDNLSGFVADEHVAHSGVTLTAGAGLTGGGDISASRSFAVGAGTGITVNADDVAITAGGVGTTQLADNGVTNAKLADMAAWSIKLRNAGTSGDPSDAALADITEDAAPAAGDFVLGFLSSGEVRKYDVDNLPGGGGGGGINVGTAQATTSGTAFDFTSLPGGINRITVLFDSVSLSGTNNLLVQLGDSGGIEATGYQSASGLNTGGGTTTSVSNTTGFVVGAANAGRASSGQMVLTRITGNTWVSSHSVGSGNGGNEVMHGGGSKTLSAELDRVRLTRTGADTFDLGNVNIFYEA